MMTSHRHGAAATCLLAASLLGAGCAANAQPPAPVQPAFGHPNSIQPETTLSINATASVDAEPDIAFITSGVETESKTAADAVSANAARMTGLIDALKDAGVAERDIQTSNFSVGPQYDYSERRNPVLRGYRATNQVTAKITDLETLGETIDAMVGAGGNRLDNVSFALEDPSAAQDEARRLAMADAIARAELYAEAAGYRVARIVTISEAGGRGPAPLPIARARAVSAEAAPTPILGGEVSYSASVSVTFELTR